MEFSNAYLDLEDNLCSLTQEELDFFWCVVGDVRAAEKQRRCLCSG